MIAVSLKEKSISVTRKTVIVRSYKAFESESYDEVLSKVPFHVAQMFEDVDDIYWVHELLLKQVIDEHAPIKEKVPLG